MVLKDVVAFMPESNPTSASVNLRSFFLASNWNTPMEFFGSSLWSFTLTMSCTSPLAILLGEVAPFTLKNVLPLSSKLLPGIGM